MPHGQYAVQQAVDVEASKQTGRDNSYRACLHAMLIFIAICIILLVCAWPWNHREAKGDKDANITDPSSAAVKGEEDIVTSTETSRTTPRTTTPARPNTRTTSKYTTSTARPTETTTYAIERKASFTGIPDVEEEPETTTEPQVLPAHVDHEESSSTHIPTTRTTSKYTTSTARPTETTTSAIERKASFTGIPDVEEEPETTTEPQVLPAHVDHEGSSTTHTQDAEVTEQPTEERRLDLPLDTVTTTEEVATTTEEVTTTTEVTTTEVVDTDVEVFSQLGDENKHTEEHIESSTQPTGSDGETEEDDSSQTSTAVTSAWTAETTPLSDVIEVHQSNDSDSTEQINTKGLSPVCESSQCKALATRMLTLMNHSVDPCDDFYEYACGGLRSNPSLLGDDPSKDAYDRIRRGMDSIVEGNSCQAHSKFKKFYKSCVEFDAISKQERISAARRILDTIGLFNDVKSEDAQIDTFTSLISKLMLYHSTPLFDLILDVDGHDPSRFSLKLTAPVFKPAFRPFDKREDCLKPSLINNLNVYYAEYTRCKKEEHTIYIKELHDALIALNITKSNSTIVDIKLNVEFQILNAFEYRPTAGEMQQQLTGKEYELMTISELQTLYPEVEWGTLVKTLLKRSLPDDTQVQVYFKDYLRKMLDNFMELTPRKQQNALLAWFAHDLYVDMVLTRDSCSRDSYCLRVASDLMEDVSSSLYLSTFKQGTLSDMRTEAQQVFSQLRSTLEVQLRDADWLDEFSRSSAVSKLKALTLEVNGGITIFLNEAFLDQRMTGIDLQDTNYVTMSASLLRRYRQQMYALYDVKPSEAKALWSHFLLPYSTQGIVIYALKKVVIPYGLMTKPMYEPTLPRYLLMARLGFVIAHELAHHFDVNGMSYGPNGKGDYLLSTTSKDAFRDMINCPKDLNSFQGYRTADDGRSIKFKAKESLSLNERLADRTAAALSHDTYLSWVRDLDPPQLPYLGLTNDQVYFLAVAQIFCSKSTILDYGVSLFEDEHPPPFLRVNTIVDNSQTFPGVFECKFGMKMNPSPDVKCEAFPKIVVADEERDRQTPYE